MRNLRQAKQSTRKVLYRMWHGIGNICIMNYILRYALTPDDINFLNITSLDYDLHTPDKLSEHDSGWCDYSTGGYIVSKNDRVIFKDVSDIDLTFLKLKFGTRLKEFHEGMQAIYNEGQQHNVGPNSVIDSETVI